MLNVLWLVGVMYASQLGLSVPARNNTEKGLLAGGSIGNGIGVLVTKGNPKGRCECAEPTPVSRDRIVACWDDRMYLCENPTQPTTKSAGLKGSVYLYCGRTNKTVAATGPIVVEACDGEGRRLAVWHFDNYTLERMKRTDLIGVGYTLCLPLDSQCLKERDLRVTVRSSTTAGIPCCDEPTRVTVRDLPTGILRASFEETVFIGQIPPIPGRGDPRPLAKQMPLQDIVRLSKAGISDDIIIRQIELTRSIYALTTESILALHEQGVSNGVIRAMQGGTSARTTTVR